MEKYRKEAKEMWGTTPAYQEFEEKQKKRSEEEFTQIHQGLSNIFMEFGEMMNLSVTGEEIQGQVKKLQDYLTKHYYTCTKEILLGLGRMYVENEEFTKNIDGNSKEGCAAFISEAIKEYCK